MVCQVCYIHVDLRAQVTSWSVDSLRFAISRLHRMNSVILVVGGMMKLALSISLERAFSPPITISRYPCLALLSNVDDETLASTAGTTVRKVFFEEVLTAEICLHNTGMQRTSIHAL